MSLEEETLPPIKQLASPDEIAGAALTFALQRLCRNCTHQERSLTLAAEHKLCMHPALPVNLVTGARKFPCVIARGYDELCGALGRHWEHKGVR